MSVHQVSESSRELYYSIMRAHSSTNPTNLQFGSGGNKLEGWQNFDSDLDVTKPLPFLDNSADQCFAEHLCEHLSSPQLLGFLDECYRILKPGGLMRMCCPVVGTWLKREHARDLTKNHGHLLVMDEDIMRVFLWMAGFEQQRICRTDRMDMDGHWKAIGTELDAAESCRMEARK